MTLGDGVLVSFGKNQASRQKQQFNVVFAEFFFRYLLRESWLNIILLSFVKRYLCLLYEKNQGKSMQ